MRLLANENVAGDIVEALRVAGHDVAWARIENPGAPDVDVIRRARDERRVLLTFDKDFGELVYRAGVAASPGVILVRLPMRSPSWLAATIVATVDGRDDWEGKFSLVEGNRVRMRPMP